MRTPEAASGSPSLADLFQSQAQLIEQEAAEHAERRIAAHLAALRENPADENARVAAARILRRLNRHQEAIDLVANGFNGTPSVDLRHRHIELLAECNRTAEAIAAARAAMPLFPDDLFLKLQEALLLPVIYESGDELLRYRERFSAGMERVCGNLPLDTAQRRQGAFTALQHHNNFYLGYQNLNDRDLQVRFGDMVQQILHAVIGPHPEPEMPPAPEGARLRIGYVSSRFQDVSAARFFLGWLRGHDSSRFELHAWHLSAVRDTVTREVSGISRTFAQFPDLTTPELLKKACESIRAAKLHALIYLDLGIDPGVTKLAAVRLAPVQCMAWDHPVTSGLSTIDYAFTSDLAEPPNGAEHYSEALVRLPGVGVCYRKPVIPWPLLHKTRSHFSLRDDAVVFLCCLSAFKFLPRNDDVFPRIALRVPKAQFVFIVTNSGVGAAFRRRLELAFAAVGLTADDHCVILPPLKHLDYWNLHRVADVFLDTIGWSSGGSVFEAIACHVPVVTLPGDLMRSRQGFAILTQLGVTDTIARDKDDYIDCAVRLASEHAYRRDIVRRMDARHELLYSDPRSIEALEAFLTGEIAARQTSGGRHPDAGDDPGTRA